MLTILMAALVAAFAHQPNRVRLFAAGCFVAPVVLHEVYLSDLDGLAYYGSAALFDLATIMVTAYVRPVPRIIPRIHVVCMASILANAAGWCMWWLYLSPALYDAAFIAIYIAAIVAILLGDNADVGLPTMGWRWPSLRGYNRAGLRARTKDEGSV